MKWRRPRQILISKAAQKLRMEKSNKKQYKTSTDFWGKADKSVTFWGEASGDLSYVGGFFLSLNLKFFILDIWNFEGRIIICSSKIQRSWMNFYILKCLHQWKIKIDEIYIPTSIIIILLTSMIYNTETLIFIISGL
jgi:hypothetical protein